MVGPCGLCVGAVVVLPLAIILAALVESPVRTPFAWDKVPDKSVQEFGRRLKPKVEQQAEPTEAPEAFGSGKMFDKIAFAYDLGNRWMSLGLDQFWRQTLLNECLQLQAGDHVLDLATGTADVALLVGGRLKELSAARAAVVGEREHGVEDYVKSAVVGVDPSIEMLRRGVDKVREAHLEGVIHLHQGDAQNLSSVDSVMMQGAVSGVRTPVPLGGLTGLKTSSLDKVTMSFGIRNVPDRGLALQEMVRVLQKNDNSRVCILEFSLPDGSSMLSKVAQIFIQRVIPLIGTVATLGRGGAEYEYLERSIVEFPSPQEFASQMTQNGLPVHRITSFAYGSVQLYAASVRHSA